MIGLEVHLNIAYILVQHKNSNSTKKSEVGLTVEPRFELVSFKVNFKALIRNVSGDLMGELIDLTLNNEIFLFA